MEIIKELAKFNHIKFHDKEHKYYLNGKKMSSVTQLIGKFKQPFDSDYWSEKKANERGILKEDILKEWKYKADFATQKGSAVHAFAENYLFNKVFPFPEQEMVEVLGSVENMFDCRAAVKSITQLFKKFYEDSYEKLVPVRAELVVGDDELGLCGMVDQLFWNEKSGELEIWDWKTNKEIKETNKWQQFKDPLNHLDVCELNTYSLQLSLYKHIIERNTNLKLGNSYIVWLNENNDTYKVFKCHNFEKEVKSIL
jgi:ATP-dependent exoDNAse (exonuclease V) beta subunit